MSRFKNFKQYVFRNLFPYYYRDYDTYKDQEGKGILERFIEICSEYLDNNIVPDIDNILDIIDIDKCQELYLNYIWEFLGEPPYANAYENNTFPNPPSREVLKYAISLYKIRGTDLFYKVLGRLYDTNITIEVQPGKDDKKPDSDGIVRDRLYYKGEGDNNQILIWYGQYLTYPYGKCGGCVHVKISFDLPYDTIIGYMEKYGWVYNNGKLYTDSTMKETVSSDTLSKLPEAQYMLKVIKKYLPVNISTKKLSSSGEELDEDNIEVTVWVPQLFISSPPNIPRNYSYGEIIIPNL